MKENIFFSYMNEKKIATGILIFFWRKLDPNA